MHRGVIELLKKNVADACDNLLLAKISQASYANERRGLEVEYKVGNQVMLSTANKRRDFKQKGDGRVAKFMPHYDGPYSIIVARPETSASTSICPTFHGSRLKLFIANDDCMFPGRQMEEPAPVLVDGLEEQVIDRIIDAKKVQNSYKYLVRWHGFGPAHDEWLPATRLEDCEHLVDR